MLPEHFQRLPGERNAPGHLPLGGRVVQDHMPPFQVHPVPGEFQHLAPAHAGGQRQKHRGIESRAIRVPAGFQKPGQLIPVQEADPARIILGHPDLAHGIGFDQPPLHRGTQHRSQLPQVAFLSSRGDPPLLEQPLTLIENRRSQGIQRPLAKGRPPPGQALTDGGPVTLGMVRETLRQVAVDGLGQGDALTGQFEKLPAAPDVRLFLGGPLPGIGQSMESLRQLRMPLEPYLDLIVPSPILADSFRDIGHWVTSQTMLGSL